MDETFGAPSHYKNDGFYNEQSSTTNKLPLTYPQTIPRQMKKNSLSRRNIRYPINEPLIKSYLKISGIGIIVLTIIGVVWESLL